MADGSNPYRQYEGFNYPTAPLRQANVGVVRRPVALTATSPTGNNAGAGAGAGGGYGYFHQRAPSSVTGGNNNSNANNTGGAGAANGSDAGSGYSNPLFVSGGSGVGKPVRRVGSSSGSNAAINVSPGGVGTPGPRPAVSIPSPAPGQGFAGSYPHHNDASSNSNNNTANRNSSGSSGVPFYSTSATNAQGMPPPSPAQQDDYRSSNFMPSPNGFGEYGQDANHTNGNAGGGFYSPAGERGGGGAGNGRKPGFFANMFASLLNDPSDAASNNNGGVDGYGNSHSAAAARPLYQTRFGCPEDDIPLLEELGVSPAHIVQKTRAVLNPFTPVPAEIMTDTDLAGPAAFAVLLALLLTLQGKIQFSAIYGMCVLGVLLLKMLLALLRRGLSVSQGEQQQPQPQPLDAFGAGSPPTSSPGAAAAGGGGGGAPFSSAPLTFIMSALGYALLPNVILALVRTLQYWLLHTSAGAIPLACIAVGWSSWCATTLLVRGLGMQAQRYLILYPILLFYAVFAALTIF